MRSWALMFVLASSKRALHVIPGEDNVDSTFKKGGFGGAGEARDGLEGSAGLFPKWVGVCEDETKSVGVRINGFFPTGP